MRGMVTLEVSATMQGQRPDEVNTSRTDHCVPRCCCVLIGKRKDNHIHFAVICTAK